MTSEQVLKADAVDGVLRAALSARRNLVETVQAGATSAYREIMRAPFAAVLGVAEFFNRFTLATNQHRAHPGAYPAEYRAAEDARIRQLRLALDARDVLTAVAEDLGKLSAAEHLALGRAMALAAGSPGESVRRIREVMTAHPGLAAFQARRNAESQRLADAQRAQQDRQIATIAAQQAADRMEAARVLLRRLAQAGIVLTTDKHGISARPATLLTPADLADLKTLKAEMTTLLDAPAAMVA